MEVPANKPLRLWPGVVIVVVQWLVRFALPVVAPDAIPVAIIGGLVGGLAIVVWWLFFSRAPWSERAGVVVLMILVLFATSRVIDVSVAKGSMGMLFPVLAVPGLSLAFVASLLASRRLSNGPRRAVMAAAILVACGWRIYGQLRERLALAMDEDSRATAPGSVR
jgi:outer membrane protein assembly factor BamB